MRGAVRKPMRQVRGPPSAVFVARDGPWHDRDLYPHVLSDDGAVRAPGTNPGLIGKSPAAMKDVDGKAINAAILAVKTADWVHDKWQDPATRAVGPKPAYCVHVVATATCEHQ